MTPEFTAVVMSVLSSGIVSYFLAEHAARREFNRDVHGVRMEFMAETVARELLSDPRWKKRTFEKIKRRLGGFEDEELRRLLVKAGAIRFYRDMGDGVQEELWGLRSLNTEDDRDGA